MTDKPEAAFAFSDETAGLGLAVGSAITRGTRLLAEEASAHAADLMSEASAAIERATAAATLDELSAIQVGFLGAAWKSTVSHATGASAIAADMFRDVLSPFESLRPLRR